jgi:hypothetical protein
MLWYGFIYYTFFIFLTTLSVFYFLRLFYVSTYFKTDLTSYFFRYILNFFLFFLLWSLSTLFYLFDFFSTFLWFEDNSSTFVTFLDYYFLDYHFFTRQVSLHFTSIYYFPFIYIFLLITTLSVLFCMAYNANELFSFMFYVLIILFAGYLLFFTDSLILFFLSYELLLVPSFFILYNFAKTRRCVEAAYLMFFWTQFGAMFLIFAFLYLFFICGTSTFTQIQDFYFTAFEVNFFLFLLASRFWCEITTLTFLWLVTKSSCRSVNKFLHFLKWSVSQICLFRSFKMSH